MLSLLPVRGLAAEARTGAAPPAAEEIVYRHWEDLSACDSAVFSVGEWDDSGVFVDGVYEGYRAQLDEAGQGVYDLLREAAKDMWAVSSEQSLTITADTTAPDWSAQVLAPAWYALERDHPEWPWLRGEGVTFSVPVLEEAQVTITITGIAEEVLSGREALSAAVEEGVAEIPADIEAGDRLQMIHDYLCRRAVYDREADFGQTAYSALVNGRASSAGYAAAFKLLCDALGFPCVHVSGLGVQNTGMESHDWNYVKVWNWWYAVDATWDDIREDAEFIACDFLLAGGDTLNCELRFQESHLECNVWSGSEGTTDAVAFPYPMLYPEALLPRKTVAVFGTMYAQVSAGQTLGSITEFDYSPSFVMTVEGEEFSAYRSCWKEDPNTVLSEPGEYEYYLFILPADRSDGPFADDVAKVVVTVTMTQRTLAAAVQGTVDKVYDGTAGAGTLNGSVVLEGVAGADQVFVTAIPGPYPGASAGEDYPVVLTLSPLFGADADKYVLPPQTLTASGRILPKPLTGAAVVQDGVLTYHGGAQTGAFTVTLDGETLTPGRDYTISGGQAIDAGETAVTVTGMGNYTGTAGGRMVIEKAEPSCSIPEGLEAAPGAPLSTVPLPSGWAWLAPETEAASTGAFPAVYTPADPANYCSVERDLTVTVQSESAPEAPGTSGGSGGDTENSGGDTGDSSGDTSGSGEGTGGSGGGSGSSGGGSAGSNGSAASSGSVSTEQSGGSASVTTIAPASTVVDGTAVAAVSSSDMAEAVAQARTGGSGEVVIAPKTAGDLERVQVSIPAWSVGQVGSRTGADLTICTPIASVTVANRSLAGLSASGGSVVAAVEHTGGSVYALSITAGGRAVESLDGGVTLRLPCPGADPGTVAVLLQDDGSRLVLRRSAAVDGVLTVPLSGPAQVEIVSNGRSFDDVSASSWAYGAVSFASGHGLFSGTGANTFSPDLNMTRGMLAAVLHNLADNPDSAHSAAFSDVDSGVYYADAVAWAFEQGIVSGYGSGVFGAEDSVTREQLAVMLYRTAGSPSAGNGGSRGFADSEAIGGYASTAMDWAVETGIINGVGNGRLDPQGLATRAQVAQMLKNYVESRF